MAEVTLAQFRDWQRKFRRDGPGFVRAMWNVEPDTWQVEVLNKLFGEEERNICVPSGHGVGKTACAAWCALLFAATRYPCKVPVTAPSASTLEDGLFAEIRHWHGRMPPAIRDLFEVTTDRVVLKASPENAFISARTARADKPDALQGIHADYVLMIVDEASGVPDAVFESARGSMSGVARFMMLLGNPVYASGFFYDAMTTGKGSPWWVRHVSCHEAKRSPPQYIQEIATLYGEESNVYRVRVLGLPPKGDADSIIPLHLIQSAYHREVARTERAPRIWGLDVGGLNQGESALTERQGNFLPNPVHRFRGIDEMQLCGRIAAEYETRWTGLRPERINIDAIGMGSPVAERLRELGLPVARVNVSEQRAISDRFYNLKAELWWRARAWFEGRDTLFPDDDAELVRALSSVKIKHHSTGKLMVESKDEFNRRLKSKAPRLDAADSFILTFAGAAITALHGRGASNGVRKAVRRNLIGVV